MSKPAQDAARRDRWLILGFWLVYVLAAIHTTLVTDTARDLIAAWDIVRGEHFVLRGPELYTTWNLGPIWYYLLALPLALTHSAAVLTLLIAVVAGLKFPLAYRLGTVFRNAETGRLALFATALPGWWLFEWLVSSHTNLAMVCVLALALQLLRWSRGGSARHLVFAALFFALSLHAHPTSLFWIFLFPAAAVQRWRSGERVSVQGLALAGIAFLLPFAPMLWDEMRQGWPMLAGTAEFVAARADKTIAAQMPGFLFDWIGLNRDKVPAQFLPASSYWVTGATTIMATLWLCALAGLPHRTQWRLPLAVVTVVLAAALFALWLRPEVPFWMVYALTPALLAFLVVGWTGALRWLAMPVRTGAVHAIGMAVAILFLSVAATRWQQSSSGWVSVPHRVVGAFSAPNQIVDHDEANASFPIIAQEDWQRWLCAQSAPISLHGDGAALQRLSQGTLRLLHCADDDHWKIGGAQGQWIALYPQFALDQLKLVPLRRFGAMGQVTVRSVLRPAEPQSDELIRDYPPWPLSLGIGQSEQLSLDASKGRLLVVSNLRAVFNELAAPQLRADGVEVLPAVRSAASWFFQVPAGQKVTLNLAAGDLRWIEVLEIET